MDKNFIAVSAMWATWVGAIATFLAVIVALFKEDITYYFQKPEVKIAVGIEPPFVVTDKSGRIRYLRLKIRNFGKIVAKRCKVRLAMVYQEGNDKAVIEDPVNLKWAGSPKDATLLIETGKNELAHVFRETIDLPPNHWELLDLFFTDLFNQRNITFNSTQSEGRTVELSNENCIVNIIISGENFKPKSYRLLLKNNREAHLPYIEVM